MTTNYIQLARDLAKDQPTGYKLNGQHTWLQIPNEIPLFKPFDESCMGPVNSADENDMRAVFYQLLDEYGMKTFAFHVHVAAQVPHMIDNYQSELYALAVELWPNENNERLARAHGKINQYQMGCRGPLCRLANREQTRMKTGSLPKDPSLENALAWMRLSWLQYLQYAKMLRFARRTAEQKPGYEGPRVWQDITLQDTILLDCVDEDALHLLPVQERA